MSEKDKEATAIGKRIRKFRKAQKLTQTELADKAGMNFNTVARIEAGKQHASEPSIRKLTKALGVQSSDILNY